jgi:YidC/Oxa1 family membrane protein insertase
MNPLVGSAGGVRFASTGPVSAASSAPETASSVMGTELKPASLEAVTDLTGSISDMPVHIGYLKELGLDYGWGPTSAMEWLIEHVHVYAGTPWWASIALAAIAVRAILFKVHIDAADNAARMQAVKPITQPLTDKMLAARGDNIEVLKIRAEIQAINKRAGIKIWKSLLPMVQIFTGYGTWTILRAMSHLPVPGMDTGGALWFHNLTIPDPYFILPASTAFALYWVLKVCLALTNHFSGAW